MLILVIILKGMYNKLLEELKVTGTFKLIPSIQLKMQKNQTKII